MSVRFKDQYFTFNKIFEKREDFSNPSRTFVKVGMSSSWKTQDGTRKYSDWICRFHGRAVNGVENLKKGDFIVCDGSFTREPYEKDGQKVWGDSQLTIFEWKKWRSPEDQSKDEDFLSFDPEKESSESPF